MASQGLRSFRFIFFVIFFVAFVFLFGGVFDGGFLGSAFGQKSGEKPTASSPSAKSSKTSGEERDRPYLRDHLHWNWNQRGRTVPRGESAAGLRFRAYRQKMAMRAMRAAAAANSAPSSLSSSPHPLIAKNAMSGAPAALSASTAWVPLGPAPLASDATGDGGQDYNWVSGRATSVLIDPADTSGNTVLLGGAYGGLWKSTNAGNLSPNPAAVVWQPLIDDQPTLAVGAIALQPGNSNVILVGTGETNNSADSYYGLGILRSADGGSTWTTPPIQSAASGQSFLGIGFSKIAFSTANPSLVVAATVRDNGLCLGLEAAAAGGNSRLSCLGPEEDGTSTVVGLYYSLNGGATWNRATLTDGSVPASATAVIYNPSQGASGTFYAFIRRHGLYSSTDGQNFTPLTTQPSAGLASANCPASSNATTCLIYRGEFAVVPGRNEMYVWVVDVQPDAYGNPTPADEGIWQSTTGGASWTQIPDKGITNCGDSAFGPNSGCGVEQGWYNLELSAIPDPPPPNSTGTDVYAGAINLYKCTLEPGTTTCTQGDWINLTHVYGCSPLAAPAHVHPDQHGIGFMVVGDTTPGYFAHDGGISRTLDGYSGLTTGSCAGTNQFDSLSQTLGSMTEFVSVSVHPTSADILLGGTQGNGSPKTSTATSSSTWQNALGGDGGFNAINPSNPEEWFAANPYVTIMKCESGSECNNNSFIQVVGSSDLGGDQGAYDTPYILDPQNSSEMLVGTCRVWQIGTSGTAPLQLSNDFDTLGTGLCTGNEINLVNAVAAGGPAPDGYSTVVYAVTNGYGPLSGSPGGEVWVTTNAGVSLMTNVTENATQNVNPNGYAISTVAMDSSDGTGNTAYVGIMGFSTPGFPTSHVWKTVNAGSSWTDWTGTGSAELPDAPVNALLVDAQAGLVYAGTDVGIFVSATGAPGWTEVGPPPGPRVSGFLPNAPVTALQLFNYAGTKTLVASTYGRGIWNYSVSANYTNVISNSPQTIFPTQTATFNGTLTAEDGYASPVNLSCTGAAPATCTLQPEQITPTATYNLTASGSVGDYSFNAHAVGTDPNTITSDAAVTLHVVDFNLTAPSPNSLTVGQGGTSGTTTFQVTAAGSFAGTVTLSCSTGLPTEAACVFSPSSSVSPTSSSLVTVTLTVTAAAGTPLGGPVTVTISAMTAGAPAAKTQTFGLTVTAPVPSFTIALTATPNTTVVDQNVMWNGTLTAVNGYSKSVALKCTAGAPGTCGIAPHAVTPTAAGAPFTVTLGSATAGTFNFAIQGTDGTLTQTTPTEALTVTGATADFTWTDTGSTSVTVLAGQSASYTFAAAPVGGGTFGSGLSFACSGLPTLTSGGPGASCAFSPATIAAGAPGTPPVTVTLTITTIGPNLGTQSGLRTAWTAGGGRPYALFLWVVLVGIVGVGRVGVGLKRRGKPRLYGGITGIGLGLGLIALISCGGVSGSGSSTTPVTVNPQTGAVLFADEPGNSWPAGGNQQQFTANQSVTWAITGGSANGLISGTGLYTPPAVVPNPATVTVTATPATAAAPGSAFLTVAAPTAVGTSLITVTATATGGAAHGDVVTLNVQ